jgi:glutamate-ammonia-ligase adenylyltransferase
MKIDQLVRYLDKPEKAAVWLRSLGLENLSRAHENLSRIAANGITLDLVASLASQLTEHLPQTSYPDMALNNLDRFIAAARNPLSLGTLWERDSQALPTLLQIFSTSQHLTDLLIRDPESYDLLRLTEGQPVARDQLVNEICSEISTISKDSDVVAALRRYKDREILRIAYGDIVRHQHVNTVTRQISFLADAICEAASQSARQKLENKRGVPRDADGQPADFVIMALGKLGGSELNYSSDIDLVFLYRGEGKTDGERSLSNQDFFQRLVKKIVSLLTESSQAGAVYRVDLRLRPNGKQGPSVMSIGAALRYYDVSGRTWERQAFVKARPIAGNIQLGKRFLKKMEPWVYRRYLSGAEITEIKALKRRIEKNSQQQGGTELNVKTGLGGIRDIEFAIQFLQLLNGSEVPGVRGSNTLAAIEQLESSGCLTMQERTLLEENYAFLRKIEHRLQIMFDRQTHTLPDDQQENHRLAMRLGYQGNPERTALAAFQEDLSQATQLNRKILDHLLNDAFRDVEDTAPEVDLILDPNPTPTTIEKVLSPYGFQDQQVAYDNLMTLAEEKIPFLSSRRCRHFLASIGQRLLQAISLTPDPDSTLVSLNRVSDSLGGKGVLWELFSFNPPTLQLYVRLCACSPYLSEILTSNPGMIDELMDSMVLGKLPSYQSLQATLTDLCHGAENSEPILCSFKNSQHLRVGVRDILNKENLQTTHHCLSDLAEICLSQITTEQYQRLVQKLGLPTIASGPHQGEPASLIILAMGKLGGQEPNYHSDLDVVFLYEAEGTTIPTHAGHRINATTNQHFFGELGQRIIRIVNQLGPHGRLYELDPRLRPTGKNGPLAVSLDGFHDYFSSGQGQLWERQALCKARPIYGTETARDATRTIVRQLLLDTPWKSGRAAEILDMRERLEQTASDHNLKRGFGGTVDIEFVVQMLQLRHAQEFNEILVPGTLDAIAALRTVDMLSEQDATVLHESYIFLRSVESGLRLMNTSARHDLPGDPLELKKLAFLLGTAGPEELVDKCKHFRQENRQRFDRIFREQLTS